MLGHPGPRGVADGVVVRDLIARARVHCPDRRVVPRSSRTSTHWGERE